MPEALQVGRHGALARGCDQEVASELEVEFFQFIVCFALSVSFETLRGGQAIRNTGGIGGVYFQIDAAV